MSGSLGARIDASPGFRAFASILGQRIRAGRSIDAHRMLDAIGAPGAVGNEIIDGWPSATDPRGKAGSLLRAGIPLPAVEALWLASFIDDLRNYDWPAMLVRAAKAAKEKKDRDAETDAG